MAAETVITYLRGSIPLRDVGKRYLSKLQKSFYRRFKLEKFILRIFEKGKMTSGRLLKDPKMREMIAKLYLDVEDTPKLLLSSLSRLSRILF